MREDRGWTQEHLAMTAGIETRTVQRLEKDLTKRLDTLQKVAAAFDVDVVSLRTSRLIPESRLVQTYFVDTHERFVSVEEKYPWHAYTRTILAPLTKDGAKQVNDLLDHIFSDRELIEPNERELWKGYVEQIEEPLTALFNLKLAIFILGERRDLMLPKNGFLKPEKPYIDDWRVQYFLVVPLHGCFRMKPTEPLHRFNENCAAAGGAIFHAVTHRDVGLHVFANALVAYTDTTNWCDACFPVLSDGSRISMEYMEQVTGMGRDKLCALTEAADVDGFLNGLS